MKFKKIFPLFLCIFCLNLSIVYAQSDPEPLPFPGTISGPTSVNYNQVPVITHTAPSGCANYVYRWEMSVENGPWVIIGNTESFPGVAITADCKIRRQVGCSPKPRVYTNTLTISVLYTSPNVENLNYVRVNQILKPSISSWQQADNLPTGQKVQTTTYFDGLGRKIQKVFKQGSFKQTPIGLDPASDANYQDIVEVYEYDALGRSPKTFLPFVTNSTPGFFKTNALTEQQTFSNTKYGEPVNSPYTFSLKTYDNSPLNQVINNKAPGSALNNNVSYKGLSSDIILFRATEVVKIWDMGYSTGSVPIDVGSYSNDKLFKTVTKDEKDKLIIQYSDYTGNIVLKKVQEKEIGSGLDMNGHSGWLCTYYVYDDFNRLRYTITPQAVVQMEASSSGSPWIVTTAIKDGLCFYQEYDKKGRVIKKHSPDAGEIWLVYDNRDRLVLTQDEKQRNRINEVPAKPKQWSYSLYDELDRIVATGLIDDSRDITAMQSMVSALIPGNKNVEVYTGSWETIITYNPVAGKIPGGGFYCQSCTESVTNTLNYHDKYNGSSLAYQSLSNADFAPESGFLPEHSIQPLVKSLRTKGITTGNKTRVIDDKHDNGILTDDQFLSSTTYVNEKGLVLQTLSTNIKTGIDLTSFNYDFAGKVLSTSSKHTATSSIYNGLISVSRSEFDLLGRQIKFSRLFTMSSADITNISKYKKLNEVVLDEFGRVKTKMIGADPVNTSTPIETQDFSYSIQGRLTGINKEYAIASQSDQLGPQWSRRFGMSMGYENGSAFGTNHIVQFNGNISGIIWRSQGDNMPRKYNYEYDNIGRFTNARFTQKESNVSTAVWEDTRINVSSVVSGYDANGNILGLQHTGIIPGTDGGVLIDNLQYQYYTNSNKLKSVIDNAFSGNPAANGKQGDFNDYSPGDGIDYIYDKNGNLEIDKNKAIIDNASVLTAPVRGIIYNYMDLPQQITIKDKSKTEYIYDASGNKLGKKLTLLTSGAPPAKTTWFIGGLVYEENELQYIHHEEGRLRIMEPVAAWSLPSNQVNYLETKGNVELINAGGTKRWGVWDYFIKDHVGNTRMVLTEEFHKQMLYCSMESANANVKAEEEQTFGKAGAGNEVDLTRVDKGTSGWPPDAFDPSVKVSKLINQPGTGGYAQAIGPNALLKVMAGDELAGTVKYYYRNPVVASTNGNILNTIVAGFINTITAGNTASGIIKDNSGNISTVNTGGGSPINQYLNNQPSPTQNSTPKAYLNILFFDEQFRYVEESSAAIMVGETDPGTKKTGDLTLSQVATKNGYVYIYISNASTNIPVYFDDLIMTHQRGAIIEDNAYYPYGLKIQGISAKAALKPNVKEGFQGLYNDFDFETGYNEFLLRDYDAQIGRWVQIDPKIIQAGMYNGMNDDPVNNIDPDGGGFFDWFISKVDGSLQYFAGKGPADVVEGFEYAFAEGDIGNGMWGDIYGNKIKIRLLEDVTVVGLMPIKVEETLRYFTNTGIIDTKISVLWGIGESIYGTLKSAAVVGSFGVPGNSHFLQERVDMLQGIHNLQMQSNLQFNGNVGAALLYNYANETYNGFANGDLWDAGKTGGHVLYDGATLFYGGEAAAIKVVKTDIVVGKTGSEIVQGGSQALDGSFSITKLGWEGYPAGAAKPSGPFRIISGEEYASALKAKNSANAALHREFPSLKGYDFHEVQPVKFGGSPTSIFNKLPLAPSYHREFTSFWRKIQNTTQPYVMP